MNKPYLFKQEGDSAELLIYGDITSYEYDESDVGGYSFSKDLANIDTDIIVRINSYGGEVSQGLAIYNLLRTFKHNVTTVCDGFACSAASVIFMAGKNRIMPNTSLLLIHNAWTMVCGDYNELIKQADDLQKITQPSIEAYKSVSSLSEDEIKSMMDKETWITADEALTYGFATEVKSTSAKQSIEDKMLYKLVMRNKELESKKEEPRNQHVEEKEEDAMASFFNGGK